MEVTRGGAVLFQAARGMIQDAVDLAKMEGLEGHARAAAIRNDRSSALPAGFSPMAEEAEV
jgi:hypothetical protein